MRAPSITGQFVVMGVSGCGKSTVASQLASRTGALFLDADDFHPLENRAKMAAGIPLGDEDRWPWLAGLNRELAAQAGNERTVFLACSALRQVYRDRLSVGLPALRFIYLRGSPGLLRQRMAARRGHFMPIALLESQLAILEEPTDAIVVSIEDAAPVLVERILRRLGWLPPRSNAPEPD